MTHSLVRRTPVRLATTLAVLAVAAGLPRAGWAETEIRVLSNRADLVSGGDALVEVVPAPPAGTIVDVGGSDVTGRFAVRANGRYIGLVTGLAVGDNVLTVTLPDDSGATITIGNYPTGGPVFSGPHLEPWDCTTVANGLGAPVDAACNATPVIDYQYISTSGGGYQPYDLDNPPGDVAIVTTDQGTSVPHIVRREQGTINRGLYAFAYLNDPELGVPEPWQPQEGINGKLFYPFGASCNTNQTQGSMPSVLDQNRLSRGFAVATTSLNVLGHHCNPVISAETAMMTKERLIEQIGEIRYTISTGGSGGAIGQLQVSNAYPGITNGLIPSQTFPDVWSTAIEVGDCVLTETYWPKAAIPFTLLQKSAVDGHGPTQSSCAAWVATFAPAGIPTTGCFSGSTLPTTSIPEPPPNGRDYNPATNPDGCRATVQDIQVNIWGWRTQDGFAKRPLDNVGVQYGLDALNLPLGNPGKIIFAQFLDLNAKIGGVDIDAVPTVARTRTDPDVSAIAYRSSNLNDGRGLAQAAIIDLPATTNIEIHTPYHAYALEARLVGSNSQADNHSIWHGGPGDLAFDTMDAWLAEVDADSSNDSLAVKIVNNKPGIASDSCWSGGQQQPLANCAADVFGDARLVAGMPRTHDVLQCRLKPIDPTDYAGAFPPLTIADFVALSTVFPEGVCDYTQPAVDEVASVQWLTYENGPGGEPLGDPPASTAFLPAATATPTATATLTPTSSPVPTATATPTEAIPTPTPTSEPPPTPTAVATATPSGPLCMGKPVTIAGTKSRDIIQGTAGDDVIDGGGGSDIIRGGDGNDTICGGAEHDVLYGEAGDDVIVGGHANDYCVGGSGEDTFIECERVADPD